MRCVRNNCGNNAQRKPWKHAALPLGYVLLCVCVFPFRRCWCIVIVIVIAHCCCAPLLLLSLLLSLPLSYEMQEKRLASRNDGKRYGSWRRSVGEEKAHQPWRATAPAAALLIAREAKAAARRVERANTADPLAPTPTGPAWVVRQLRPRATATPLPG